MSAPIDFRPECPRCGDVNHPRALKCATCECELYLYRRSCIYCGWPTVYPDRACLGHCDLNDDPFASLDLADARGLDSTSRADRP